MEQAQEVDIVFPYLYCVRNINIRLLNLVYKNFKGMTLQKAKVRQPMVKLCWCLCLRMSTSKSKSIPTACLTATGLCSSHQMHIAVALHSPVATQPKACSKPAWGWRYKLLSKHQFVRLWSAQQTGHAGMGSAVSPFSQTSPLNTRKWPKSPAWSKSFLTQAGFEIVTWSWTCLILTPCRLPGKEDKNVIDSTQWKYHYCIHINSNFCIHFCSSEVVSFPLRAPGRMERRL